MLPKVNRRLERRGQQPVGSLQELRDRIPAPERRRRMALGFVSMPLLFIGIASLVHDLVTLGDDSPLPGLPLVVVVGEAVLFGGLLGAAWSFSAFRHRTVVLALQVVILGGLLVAGRTGAKTTVSWVDVVTDVLLLVLVAAQLRPSADGGRQRCG